MKLYILIFCLVFLATTNTANACRYKQQPFDQLIQSAPVIFIGKVSAVENGKVTFAIDTGIKGVAGGVFVTEIGQSSCDIRFESSETWLYMGSVAPSGSLLLVNSTGQVQAENAALIKKEFNYDITATDSTSFNGTLGNSCAPWDGAAFGINLQSGLHAQVWTRLPKIGLFSKTYPAHMNAGKEGEGSIIYCPSVPPGAPPSCQRLEGSITLTEIKDGAASGYIDVKEGKFAGRNAFHVRIIHAYELCG